VESFGPKELIPRLGPKGKEHWAKGVKPRGPKLKSKGDKELGINPSSIVGHGEDFSPHGRWP
jgi:hypothetical protein